MTRERETIVIIDALVDTDLFTYLLSPRNTVLLEKLIGSQLARKFPLFYRTRRYIITFTSGRHLTLS
jgi:hypothetical protein